MAIDGPSAAGKSTVGRGVAQRLGYLFLDTGAMYRAVTFAALQEGVDLRDEEALVELAHSLQIDIGPPPAGSIESCSVSLNGQDVTDQLRLREVESAVSLVSRIPGVRHALVRIQREIASKQSVVMAGRDIGTVVLPDAPLKIYLEASVEERARRRFLEMQSLGRKVDFEQVKTELSRRDRIDTERATSPLIPAPDAVIINTDDLTLEQVIDKVLELVRARLC
ncbi:MAG TPA: (d)CMP kinase [Dehalococcoidia bacterium]|nr:(d)CMP kinase [Dehalococcoidia bacterium]